jgi:hypothetical protein
MQETWRDVQGYEGLYMVSNLGNVKALPRFHNNNGCGYMQKERIMLQGKRGRYPRVTLRKDGIAKDMSVHRLVAMAFIPNPEKKPCVNHIDNNPENNCVDNLEWCTHRENALHAYRVANVCHGRKGKHHTQEVKEIISKKGKGRIPPNAAFTVEEARDIKTRKQAGERRKAVYEDYKNKITKGGFENIWYGRTYKEVLV